MKPVSDMNVCLVFESGNWQLRNQGGFPHPLFDLCTIHSFLKYLSVLGADTNKRRYSLEEECSYFKVFSIFKSTRDKNVDSDNHITFKEAICHVWHYLQVYTYS